MRSGRSVRQRGNTIGNHRQQIEIHIDERGGIFCNVPAFRDHDGNGFPHMNHFVICQGRPIQVLPIGRAWKPDHQPFIDQVRFEIGERKDAEHTWHGERCFLIDGIYEGVTVRAAQKRRMELTGKKDIVNETALAFQQGRIFETFCAAAKDLSAAHLGYAPF